MYLKFIGIKNIGAIEELKIEPSFTDEGNPKPIVIVGENGTGKTILLSSIMDSFYEIAGELFDNVAKRENTGKHFYKIKGSPNLRVGKKSGFVVIQYRSNVLRKNIEYIDCINTTNQEVLELKKDFKLLENSKDSSSGCITSFTGMRLNYSSGRNPILPPLISESEKSLLQREWHYESHYYQPAYRYEEPFWKNPMFYTENLYNFHQKYAENLSKEIEIVSSFEKNKSFVMDVVLDKQLGLESYVAQTINERNDVEKTKRNIDNLANIETSEIKISKKINEVIGKIKKQPNIRFGIASRHWGSRLTICKEDGDPIMPNIDCLSLGEGILFNMFINIIRHCDPSQKGLEDFRGIVVIDEVDTHLHSNLQSEVLPKLIKLFPKIQFILTTHSPLFVLGMQREFGDEGFDLIEMPTGAKITAERFREFEEAYRVLAETKKFEDELKDKLEAKIKTMSKPKVFVEGKTDVQYIEKALKLYGRESLLQDLDIEQIGHEGKKGAENSNDEALKGAKRFLESNPKFFSQKVLILHDPETKNVNRGNFGRDEKLCIDQMPFYEENPIKAGIENLFLFNLVERCYGHCENQDKDLLSRTIKDDEPPKYKINDKKKVCDWLCQNGTKEDFRNFERIIEILDEFLQDKDSDNGESQ